MANNQSPIISMFKIPDLRRKILVTLFILFIYRLGAYIPVPGIDMAALSSTLERMQGGILDYIDLFTGGGLKKFTIFALGIMPYISAEIILQLLIGIIPALETSHAIYYLKKLAKNKKVRSVLLCLSGRGDKDLNIIQKYIKSKN